jgi:hypothetical protein
MILFDQNTSVVFFGNDVVRIREFRSRLNLSDDQKVHVTMPLENYKRLDLQAAALYGDISMTDLLLEFTDKPYFEWGVNEAIIAVSPQYAVIF